MANAFPIGLHLVNPNTSKSVTKKVVQTARARARANTAITGITATEGPAYIVTQDQNALAADEVLRILCKQAGACDGAIIAAFSDPGLFEAKAEISVPVVGIGEAAMCTSASLDGRFAIVTCAPLLADVFTAHAEALGYRDRLAGIWAEEADLERLGKDPTEAAVFLAGIIRHRLPGSGVTSVILGGAPFTGLDAEVTHMTGVPVFDGVACAVDLAETTIIARRNKMNMPA